MAARSRAILILCVVLTALAACATRPRAEWNVRPDTEVASYETFLLAPPTKIPSNMTPDELTTWKSNRDLVGQLIRSDLTSKGYREAEDGAQLLVRYTAGNHLKKATYFEGQKRGEIDVFVTDRSNGSWVWHGWVTETITEKLDREQEVRKAVPLVMSKFPAR